MLHDFLEFCNILIVCIDFIYVFNLESFENVIYTLDSRHLMEHVIILKYKNIAFNFMNLFLVSSIVFKLKLLHL